MKRPNIAVLVVFVAFSSHVNAQTEKADGLPAIVIIHGAWGGSHHWKETAEGIAAGYEGTVHRASLTGLGPRVHLATKQTNLSTHIQDVVNLIEFNDLQPVILIAHSYGGVVASGVADAIPNRINRVMYLDAHLLDDGETYLSHHPDMQSQLTKRANEDGDGWLIPVDWQNSVRDVPHPLATLTQPIELKNEAAKTIPSTYWLFTDGGKAENDSRFTYYQRAKQRGWPVRTFTWGHNPQRSIPKEIASELLSGIKE
ncbi:MAG: alpha/beta hydrolase [Pirellulaceae bacterium]